MKTKKRGLFFPTDFNNFYFGPLAIFLLLSVLLEGFYYPFEYLPAVVVFLVLLIIALWQKRPIKANRETLLWIAFIAITFTAAWLGVDRGQAVFEAYRYLLYGLVFVISVQLAPAQIPKIYGLLFVTGVLLAFFTLSTIGTDFFISSVAGDYRLQGTFSYANTTAIYLLMTLGLGLYLGARSQGLKRMSFIAGTYLAAAALFLTGSRTVWLMWPVALFLSVMLAPGKERTYWLINGSLASLAGIAAGYYAYLYWIGQHNDLSCFIIALGIFIIGGGLYPLQDRIDRSDKYGPLLVWSSGLVLLLAINAGLILLGSATGRTLAWNASELQGRLIYYTDALSIIRDHVWLGIGGGGWAAIQFLYQTAYYNVTLVHSSILQIALDTGVVGLILFVGLIAVSLLYILRNKEHLFKVQIYAVWWPALLGGGLIFVHSLVDMDLSFPGAAGPLFFFLGSLCISGGKSST